jgi:hypothetical protein
MFVAGCGSKGIYAIELTTSDWQAKPNITIFLNQPLETSNQIILLLE